MLCTGVECNGSRSKYNCNVCIQSDYTVDGAICYYDLCVARSADLLRCEA